MTSMTKKFPLLLLRIEYRAAHPVVRREDAHQAGLGYRF